jgi:cytochrome c
VKITRTIFVGAALLIAATVTAARAEQVPGMEDDILKSKCTLCHSSHRTLTMDPKAIKPVLERMQKMNPDWISDVERDHVAEVLVRILENQTVATTRTAWMEAVETGRGIFEDRKLGKSGASCSSCHQPGSLKQVADTYPRFDQKLKRFVDLSEAINAMIKDKVGGEPFPVNDQRLLSLIAYIKTLR